MSLRMFHPIYIKISFFGAYFSVFPLTYTVSISVENTSMQLILCSKKQRVLSKQNMSKETVAQTLIGFIESNFFPLVEREISSEISCPFFIPLFLKHINLNEFTIIVN